MNVPPAAAPHPLPTPAFTLATALRWLEHHCARSCSSSLDDLPAAIWFVRPSNFAQQRGAIVIVDATASRESVARVHRLIRDINLCSHIDNIQVRERHMADIKNALNIATREPDPLSRCHLQLVVQEPASLDGDDGYGPDSPPDRAGVRLVQGRGVSLPGS